MPFELCHIMHAWEQTLLGTMSAKSIYKLAWWEPYLKSTRGPDAQAPQWIGPAQPL